jgi:hypothetical protein
MGQGLYRLPALGRRLQASGFSQTREEKTALRLAGGSAIFLKPEA